MLGSLHRVARWLRLALACLALAGAGVPAHALPELRAVVTVSAERETAAKPRPAARVSASRVVARRVERPGRTPFAGRSREARPPGPPRRLFLTHRALLW